MALGTVVSKPLSYINEFILTTCLRVQGALSSFYRLLLLLLLLCLMVCTPTYLEAPVRELDPIVFSTVPTLNKKIVPAQRFYNLTKEGIEATEIKWLH